MKNGKNALLVFSMLVTAWAVLLLLWAHWPSSVTKHTTTLHLIAPSTWNRSTIDRIASRTYLLSLTYPDSIKIGQTAHYQLDIEGLPGAITVNGIERHVRVRSELILPGFINQQPGIYTQNIQDQKTARFTWNVSAHESRNAKGVVRVFVDYISPDNIVDSELNSATEIQLTSFSLAGLSVTDATSLSVALVLLAGLAGGFGLSRPRSG